MTGGGCPETVWDGPYSMRCGLGGGTGMCGTHGPFGSPEGDRGGSAGRAQWRYATLGGRWVLAQWTAGGEPVAELAAVDASTLMAIAPAVRSRVAEAMLEQHGIRPPAAVFDGPPDAQVSMTCGRCWRVSWQLPDVRGRYCGACHVFTEDYRPLLGEPSFAPRVAS